MSKPGKYGVIASDFDGVLRDTRSNEPIPGAKLALRRLVNRGWQVYVHTTNNPTFVWNWLHEQRMAKYVTVVSREKPPADWYVDDRAIAFSDWPSALSAIGR